MSEFTFETTTDEVGAKSASLAAEGALTIATAGELHHALITALDECSELVVDGSAVSEVDLAALQVLCALHRSAVARGKTVVMRGVDDGCWPETLTLAGFSRHEGCVHATDKTQCLWCP